MQSKAEWEIFTTREIAYGHYGYAAYRIEVDITDRHHPLQRHIWTLDDGTTREDEWIRGVGGDTPESLAARGYFRVADLLLEA